MEAYFLGQAWMSDHKTSTHSQKLTWNIDSVFAQWSKQDTVFTCPSAIIYKFYLPGAMGKAPMSSPDYNAIIYLSHYKSQDTAIGQLP